MLSNKETFLKLLAFMQGAEIDPQILYDYPCNAAIGEYRYPHDVHFPVPIPGLCADGVFVTNEYYLRGCDRGEQTTKIRAIRYCKHRNYLLPSDDVATLLSENVDFLNVRLKTIGWPMLSPGQYWGFDTELVSGPESVSVLTPDGILWVPKPPDPRNVRGCLKVAHTGRDLNYCAEADKETYRTSPFGYILSVLKNQDVSYRKYLQQRGQTYPLVGWYRLKNEQISQPTVYDEEKGVFVTPNLCLDTHIPTKAVTHAEAVAYCKFYDLTLPTVEDLERIARNASSLNAALKAINLSGVIPEDGFESVDSQCWTEEKMSQTEKEGDDEQTSLLLFPIQRQERVPDIYVFLEELGYDL
jgi:hypothetical protein